MQEISCNLSTFGFQMLPAPAVRAFCYIPRIKYNDWVDFLIDTGASESCLNGIFTVRLQQQMRPSTLRQSMGIGTCDYYSERAVLLFKDIRGRPIGRVINLGVQKLTPQHLNDPDMLHCPCLLGRDIINDWAFDYQASRGSVSLKTY